MTKKKEILAILLLSILLTTTGILVDSDPKNSSVWTTIFEYFAMLTILFVILILIYYLVSFSFRKMKEVMS